MSIFQDSSSLLNESRKIQRHIQEELIHIQEGKRAARRSRGKQSSSAPELQPQPEKKEPKQRSAFRADVEKKGVASPQTTDLSKAVKMVAGRQIPDNYSRQDKKGVDYPQAANLDKAVKMVAGRQIPKKEAPAAPQAAKKEEPKAAPKPRETRKERKARVTANAPARKERIAARRAAKNREVSDLKVSGSQLKKLYYSAPEDRETKNRERIARGIKGGVRKYAEKIKDAGKRVVGKIKKFFGKEDVDLLFASQVILECDGYTPDEIEIILEWIDSQLDQEETFNCITILENAIDDLLFCQYIVENYTINTELDIEMIVEDMTDDEFEYVFENYIEEEVPVDRRLKSNRYVSKSFKRKKPMKPSY